MHDSTVLSYKHQIVVGVIILKKVFMFKYIIAGHTCKIRLKRFIKKSELTVVEMEDLEWVEQ